MKTPKIIHINGRRWFDRKNGNTYHSVRIWLDGNEVGSGALRFNYGYGDHYKQTAIDWLIGNGKLPAMERYTNGVTEQIWQYCERLGINLGTDVADVGRKGDL